MYAHDNPLISLVPPGAATGVESYINMDRYDEMFLAGYSAPTKVAWAEVRDWANGESWAMQTQLLADPYFEKIRYTGPDYLNAARAFLRGVRAWVKHHGGTKGR